MLKNSESYNKEFNTLKLGVGKIIWECWSAVDDIPSFILRVRKLEPIIVRLENMRDTIISFAKELSVLPEQAELFKYVLSFITALNKDISTMYSFTLYNVTNTDPHVDFVCVSKFGLDAETMLLADDIELPDNCL